MSRPRAGTFHRVAISAWVSYGVVASLLQEPIYLITNLDLAEEACCYYRLRFRIETFFSDQKSRGFYLHKSHLADPQRLARLLIAACLAYIWLVYLGTVAKLRPIWLQTLHRRNRCDLSLFQLGRALLEHFLNADWPILVSFKMLPRRLC